MTSMPELGLSIRRRYNIYGCDLLVETGCSSLAFATDEILGPFACGDVAGPGEFHLILEAVVDSDSIPAEILSVPSRVQKLRTDEVLPYRIYATEGRWVVDVRPIGMLSLDLKNRQASCWIVNAPGLPTDVPVSFVRLAVIEILRSKGLFAVHAAVLARGHSCIAIVGPSGRGKTTAAIALVRAGYRCLSDDSPVLREVDNGFEFLSFPSRFSVTARTISWFDELRMKEATFRADSRKRSFAPHEIFGDYSVTAARPIALIFPQIVDWPESYLKPMSAVRAFEELLPQTLLLLDRDCAVRQFDMFGRLARSTRSFRLYFGEDVLNLPSVLGPLFAGTGVPNVA